MALPTLAFRSLSRAPRLTNNITPLSSGPLNARLGSSSLRFALSPCAPAVNMGRRCAATSKPEAYEFIVRTLDDVKERGSFKESSRGLWESRRYLTREDGCGFSFHHTVLYNGTSTFHWYKNHVETVYITQGEGTIEIVPEGSPEKYEHGSGKLYHLKPGSFYGLRGQRHILTATKGDLHCMCVFNPPVAGPEDHDEQGVYPAIDDQGNALYEYGPDQVPALFKPPECYEEGSEWCK